MLIVATPEGDRRDVIGRVPLLDGSDVIRRKSMRYSSSRGHWSLREKIVPDTANAANAAIAASAAYEATATIVASADAATKVCYEAATRLAVMPL